MIDTGEYEPDYDAMWQEFVELDELAIFYSTHEQEDYPPMTLHPTTFEYLKPTDDQIAKMAVLREAARVYAEALDANLPDGPDKTFVLRAHRSNAMWVNVAITRLPDGTPRE